MQILDQEREFKDRSESLILQLLQERQILKDKNRHRIVGEIEDVSVDISCCNNQPYSEEARERKPKLVKLKADLEQQLRKENIDLWRDTEELRIALLDAQRKNQSSQLRSQIMAPSHNAEHKEEDNTMDSGHMSGS